MAKMLLLLGVCLGFVLQCACYKAGAPSGACGSMFPKHGVDSQTSASPYTITVSPNTPYTKGTNLTVTIVTSSPNDRFFEGFFLQARKADCSDAEIAQGMFYVDAADAEIKTLACSVGVNNAVTHTTASKKTTKTFTWKNDAGGDVYFQGTFVNHKETFWSNIQSAVLLESGSSATYSKCKGKTTQGSAHTQTVNFTLLTGLLILLAA